jgi:hypothetical protein
LNRLVSLSHKVPVTKQGGDHTMNAGPDRAFYREYDLHRARLEPCKKEPAGHQSKALDALAKWYESKPFPDAGGILVLPTGAGTTFTTIRFLCRGPLPTIRNRCQLVPAAYSRVFHLWTGTCVLPDRRRQFWGHIGALG